MESPSAESSVSAGINAAARKRLMLEELLAVSLRFQHAVPGQRSEFLKNAERSIPATDRASGLLEMTTRHVGFDIFGLRGGGVDGC
jgi:hypothetical protein